MTSTARGDDVWWPTRLEPWYDGWRRRRSPEVMVTIHAGGDLRGTWQYYDWYVGAATGIRFLTRAADLNDPRWNMAPPDLPAEPVYARDELTMPADAPAPRRRDSGTNSEPSELSLLSSISGTNSSSESSPELPSIGIGNSGPGQWMGEHGITPFELDEPPTTFGMLYISVSSSITSRVPYLRCRSNRARTCSSLSTQKILNLNGSGGKTLRRRYATRLTNEVPTAPNPMLRRMTDFSSSRVTTGYIWNTTGVGDRNQMPSLSRPISPFG
ncbi:hypothetical protein PIB30_041576 [Stylosanthes scabra]|uniref:Uncharacterized protein n=1 Tax=Stylosanthes scabra TaxID=79078 RepID=A0ABU6RF72_9FABA|nr:hypothetical protein [Stylosanthes scabra]